MRALKALSLAANNIIELDNSLTVLSKLQYLNLNGNNLTCLPNKFGSMMLKRLILSYNRIESLAEDFMEPNLVHTLSSLSISNNNLIELPVNFVKCERIKVLQYDGNPIISPPIELMLEGLEGIFKYGRIRKIRINEMKQAIVAEGFDTNIEHFTPVAESIITSDNTGFLTPLDMRDFDDAVDRYVNGKFYNVRIGCKEIMEKFVSLKEYRLYEFYSKIMVTMLDVLRLEVRIRDDFSPNVLRSDIVRKWGRDGEEVHCYAIALHALLEDAEPNNFVQEWRPALYDIVKDRLPPTIFNYSTETLKQGIKWFKDAYGRIAKIENVEFSRCECIDPETKKEARHFPCIIPALVINKIIYTPEEADRREIETKKIKEAFKTIDETITKWFATQVGRSAILKAVRERRSNLAVNITMEKVKIEEMII